MKNETNSKITEPFDGFEAWVGKTMKDWQVPGCAIAVVQGDQTLFLKGFGFRDVKNKKPVDAETVFAIASTSKAFTTAAMAMLVERGLLEWDRPVREYLPDFKLFDPFASEHITPRDLVCHRSGLPRHDSLWWQSPFTRRELIEKLPFLEPNRDLRTTYQYNNLMFTAAGVIIERISGGTWEDFIQKEIFDKLGMSHSQFSVETSKVTDDAALPYVPEKKGFKRVPFGNVDALGPAGGINSCAADLTNWVKLQLARGKFNGEQLISEAALEETHQPNIIVPPGNWDLIDQSPEFGPVSYAMGWNTHDYRGHRMLRHSGGLDGFSCLTTLLPDDQLGFVVLTNCGDSNYSYVPSFILADHFLGLEKLHWNERLLNDSKRTKKAAQAAAKKEKGQRLVGTQPSRSLKEYAGRYEHPAYGILHISHKDKALTAQHNLLDFKLVHYHYDVFELVNDLYSMRIKANFTADSRGHISAVSLPLETHVKPIVFTRLPEKKLQKESTLRPMEGTYELDGQTAVVTYRSGSGLALALPNQTEFTLLPYLELEFKVSGFPNASVEFLQDKNGEICALEFIKDELMFKGKKK
jgi:CubicO group peptidase (beta-lactamase class C family)